MDAVRLFQVVAYPQTRLDVHYPVPRERHLYQPSGVLAAPVVYEPRRAFVGTDHIQRDELRSALCGHLLLEHIERQSAEDILRTRPDLGDVRVELINVELPREVRYLLLHELIARRDNRRADTLLIAAAEKYLLVARDESMRDDVLDSEDVPQRVGNGLAVVAVRVDERDSTELLARELLPERIYRVHELPAEPEQRGDAVLERVPLFQLRLHLLVELRPLLVHAVNLLCSDLFHIDEFELTAHGLAGENPVAVFLVQADIIRAAGACEKLVSPVREALLYLRQQPRAQAYAAVVGVYHELSDIGRPIALVSAHGADNAAVFAEHFQYNASVEFRLDLRQRLLQRRYIPAAEQRCLALIREVLER